jgi:hypothetical protein
MSRSKHRKIQEVKQIVYRGSQVVVFLPFEAIFKVGN